MPQETISYKDATVTVDAGIFHAPKITVECRSFRAENLTTEQFAELIYPAINQAALQAALTPEKETGPNDAA